MSSLNVEVKIGDIFDSKATTLVNTVNCVGVMGKGIAQEFKNRYPDMYKQYKKECELEIVKPGVPYIYKDVLGTSIINFPTKNHWRSPSKLNDIIKGLDIFLYKYKSWGIKSVAFPPLGCGNGGLEWEFVGPTMFQKLSDISIPVEIYAPYGTLKVHLTPEYLKRKIASYRDIKGNKVKKMNPAWISILEVMHILGKQYYSKPVGRTIFQKICYVLTEQGIDTGFKFNQSSYGPFSSDVNSTLSVFANMNLINEIPLGKMNSLSVGSEYIKLIKKYDDVLNKHKKIIFKTADLFSRIKNTEQAEEVTTVIYASHQLKKEKDTNNITEKDLYDYIINWKRNWDKPEKKKSVGSTIRNLEMLDWLKLKYSDTLPVTQQH